jgi:hypothetical protein
MIKLRTILFSAFFALTGFAQAQTILQAGDIAFVGIQSGYAATPTPKDRFAFVLLKNVEPNTEIMFNDNSVLSAAPLRFCKNESLAKWKSNIAVNAGTVIMITEGDTNAIAGKVTGSVSLSQTGDQIFGIQVNGADTLVLAGISITNWESNCVATCGGATNNSISCLPAPLNSSNSITLATTSNNGFLNNSQLNGTPAEILSQINNPVNWTLSDSAQIWNPSTWQISLITSVWNSTSNQNFTISPNPTFGIFDLPKNNDLDRVHISNALGVKVMEINPKNTQQCNLSGLSNGIYFIQFYNAKGESRGVSRVIKK